MISAGKIRAAVFAAILSAATLLSALAISPFSARGVLAADVKAEPPAPLAYRYVMSAPEAAAADGGYIYVLDDDGGVTRVASSGRTASVNDNIALSGIPSADEADKISVLTLTENDTEQTYIRLCGAATTAVTAGTNGGNPVFYEIYDSSVKYIDPTAESSAAVELGGLQPSSGCEFVGGAAYGDTLYLIERADTAGGYRFSLLAYDASASDDENTPEMLVIDLNAYGNTVAAAAANEYELVFATESVLYSLSLESGDITESPVGGITSLTFFDGEPYYTTAAGKLYAFGDDKPVLSMSEKISVASRRGTVAFADGGNDRVTVMRDGSQSEIRVKNPAAAAIGYTGTLFVASDKNVVAFDGNDQVASYDAGAIITDICVDTADILADSLYVLTESGELLFIDTRAQGTPESVTSGVTAIAARPDGGVFALGSDGGVTEYFPSEDGFATESTGVTAAGGTDIDSDRAGDLFVLTDGGISAYILSGGVYGAAEQVQDTKDLAAFEICETEFSSDGYAISFGDMITVGKYSGATDIVPASSALTDMKNGDYSDFENAAMTSAPLPKDEAAQIYRTAVVTEIYPFPVESPSTSGDIEKGAYVILVAAYEDSDYGYAIVESETRGSLIGYVDLRALEKCAYMTDEETEEAYGADLRRYVRISGTVIRKYPSLSAPGLSLSEDAEVYAAETNAEFTLAPFIDDYRDSDGERWYRVIVDETGGPYDGYVRISVMSDRSGSQIEPRYNGEVHAPDGRAVCYDLVGGNYVENGMTVADGTPVEVIGDYTKSEEYTRVRYTDEEGTVRECWLLTSQVRMTEAGWYQVVMFIVAAVVVLFLAVLVIVFVKRRKKID